MPGWKWEKSAAMSKLNVLINISIHAELDAVEDAFSKCNRVVVC